MSPYFFLILYDKEQQSYSLPVILTYLIFVITTFRDVFKVYNFFFYLRISEKNPWKMWHNRSSLLGTFQITIWNFLNSELQETFMHFTHMRRYLLWWIILNYIILIFFLDCFIVLYLRFYILGWSASKIYDRYMWMGLTPIQVWDLLSEILLGVGSSAEYCHQFCSLSSIFLETAFINCVYKFFS